MKFHPSLTVERWRSFPWDKRLLNIAAELSRAKNLIRDKEYDWANQAIARALELVDLTVEAGTDDKPPFFLRELLRFRELLAGFYVSEEKEDREFITMFRGFLDLDPDVHNLQLRI